MLLLLISSIFLRNVERRDLKINTGKKQVIKDIEVNTQKEDEISMDLINDIAECIREAIEEEEAKKEKEMKKENNIKNDNINGSLDKCEKCDNSIKSVTNIVDNINDILNDFKKGIISSKLSVKICDELKENADTYKDYNKVNDKCFEITKKFKYRAFPRFFIYLWIKIKKFFTRE